VKKGKKGKKVEKSAELWLLGFLQQSGGRREVQKEKKNWGKRLVRGIRKSPYVRGVLRDGRKSEPSRAETIDKESRANCSKEQGRTRTMATRHDPVPPPGRKARGVGPPINEKGLLRKNTTDFY